MSETQARGECMGQSGIKFLNFIREEMRHEDNLIVQRIVGLFAVQAFLFYVYFNDRPTTEAEDRVILPYLGVSVSVLFFLSILAAINTFLHWKNKWIHLNKTRPELESLALNRHPITVGWGFLPGIVVPPVFGGYWVYVILSAGSAPLARWAVWGLIAVGFLTGCLTVAALVICFVESRWEK